MDAEPGTVEFLRQCGVGEERFESLPVLAALYEDLVRANRGTNLTRITDPASYWLLHVADSLAVGLVHPCLMTSAKRVADVGCGAGFPLFPLAWANPRLDLTGIESRQRKAAFVEHEIQRCGFRNCRIVPRRAREVARLPEHSHRYDIVLLRAVGSVGKLLYECRDLPRRHGGAMIFYKTPLAAPSEANEARCEAARYGFRITLSDVIELPGGVGQRQYVLLQRDDRRHS